MLLMLCLIWQIVFDNRINENVNSQESINYSFAEHNNSDLGNSQSLGNDNLV